MTCKRCPHPTAPAWSAWPNWEGRTPLDMLYYVQRDGFEECEECIQASMLADQDIAQGRVIPHDEVMEEARRMVEFYASRASNAK
ncbi:hypothetical protein [Pseudoduganella sp. UC29_71]|jgi:hypothetical protein|uniref:hypothetical protein n=1 Tax=Pseudoduganella sp. UC29_71 TaxID=3350174 RepID=UPI00366B0423